MSVTAVQGPVAVRLEAGELSRLSREIERGLCASSTTPDDWFPLTGVQDERLRAKARGEAQRLCAGCPVLVECRTWARVTGQQHGVWGGELDRQRVVRGQDVRPAAEVAGVVVAGGVVAGGERDAA
jgi:WhiB family redox-sensing transcriptional regulator